MPHRYREVQLPAERPCAFSYEGPCDVFGQHVRGTEGGVGHGNVSSVGSSGEGSGDVVMSAQTARAFSTPPRGGTRGADLVAGDGTGRGDRARARHNANTNGDVRVENLQDVFANVRLTGQGGHCPVQGCCYSEAAGHPGLTSTEGLKTHIDAHLLHVLDGEVPEEWMR